MNAAPGPLAWAIPVKNRMNGTLPPTTAITSNAPARRPDRARTSPAPPVPSRIASSMAPTRALRAPVSTTGSANSLTIRPLTKIETPEMRAVRVARAMPQPTVRGTVMTGLLAVRPGRAGMG